MGNQAEEQLKRIYARYIELLNAQDYEGLGEVVDPGRYREICVGFTPGWVDLPEAVSSLKQVTVGIPDLAARIDDSVAQADDDAGGVDGRVYARLTATGTNAGRFYGAPPTGRSYEVSMFDYARIEDGQIVERIQQSDTLSQLRQMYSGAAKKAAAGAGVFTALATILALARRRGGMNGR
jgi:predicted ester cyclase